MIVLSTQKHYVKAERHTYKDTLPREAVRMTSGVSEEVAIAVTQPE
jgi:hypothetical protein